MELPLKEIVFKPGENKKLGLFAVSAVGNPAIQENSIFFNSETQLKFSLNEEQRIVFGPALIPGQKVYRNNGKEEYNVFASKETIELIAIDFAENSRYNNVNLDHEEQLVSGVPIYQCLITNENTVPYVKGWEHLPIGTLFYGAKVKNDEVWQGFKDGKYQGWSIHAYFEQQLLEMSEDLDSKALQVIEKIISSMF